MKTEAQGPDVERPRSVLLMDIGTVLCKAVFVDRSTGRCRVIARGEAPTTLVAPWEDVTLGLRDAVNQVSVETGRELFDRAGGLISPQAGAAKGVDLVVVTVSAAPSLGLVICGLSSERSLASARMAASGAFAQTLAALSAESTGGVWRASEWARRIGDAGPDVILIAGGTEGGGAAPVLLMVLSALSALPGRGGSREPIVLFAGDSHLQGELQHYVSEAVDLRFVGNVRPALDREDVAPARRALDETYIERRAAGLPGFNRLAAWLPAAIEAGAGGFARFVAAVAAIEDRPQSVLGVDVGAARTVVASATGGDLSVAVSDAGIARIDRVMGKRGMGAVARWMPFALPRSELAQLLGLRAARPALAPQTDADVWLDQALAREAILAARPQTVRPSRRRLRLREWPTVCDIIVAGGSVLARAPRPAQAALVLLDALEPAGITRLLLDVNGLAAPLGALAGVDPACVVEVLDSGGLVELGTVIAPLGRARLGERVLRARVTPDGGADSEFDVRCGDLQVVPLAPGQEADVELRLRRGYEVGPGYRRRGGKLRVRGGLVGLVLDARGRPLKLAVDAGERVREACQWLSAIEG